MSPLDQGTEAAPAERATAPANPAVSSAPPDATPWPKIDAHLLDATSSRASRVAVPAFPLALLGEPWRGWVSDAARSAGAPVDYVAQALLASVAGLSGRRVMVIPSPGWQEPLRLWLAAVGAPSTGKSPALASVSRLLWRLEADPTGDGTKPRRQIVLRDGDSFDRIVAALVRDPRGMMLWRDGPAGCLAPFGRGHTLRHLEPLAPSILGTIEPDAGATSRASFRASSRPGSRSGGADSLVSRFLYAWPQPMPFRPLGERLVLPGDELLAPMRRVLHVFDALTGAHGLFLDPAANRAFDAFLARLHGETREAEGSLAAWLGKGGGAVACLAGTFAVMAWAASTAEGLPGRVDRDAVERAVSLWSDYYRPHARAFLQRAAPGDRESDAARVMRWLSADRRASLSREEVRRTALGQSVSAGEADQVIERLVEGGVLRPLPRTPGVGRPALRWAVNPLLAATDSRRLDQGRQGRVERPSLHDKPPIVEARSLHSALRASVETTETASANSANGANREIH